MLLIVLVLEKVFAISRSRLFPWFFWVYNAGVILTSGMLVLHGSLTVLGMETSKAIAGIAGTGHILVTAGLILLMLALRKPVFGSREREADAQIRARWQRRTRRIGILPSDGGRRCAECSATA